MASAKKPKGKAVGLTTEDASFVSNTPPSTLSEVQAVSAPAPEPVVSDEVVEYGSVVEEPLPGGTPKLHFDETDVAFALARHTEDGKGERVPDPGDFEGFPAEGVIKEE